MIRVKKKKEVIRKERDLVKRKNKKEGRRISNLKGSKNDTHMLFAMIVGFVMALLVFLIYRNLLITVITAIAFFGLTWIYFVVNNRLKIVANIKKMEDVFPDFISLMASNLRAGMTVDRSLLLSSRKEFAPLDKEILRLGKDIVTGKDIMQALKNMGNRIHSDKIGKTINLILSGIRSGGDLAVLLEQTAQNMRERNFVEKRAASNVLMYVIFIFFAVSIGAPILFGLSSVLVEILTNILGNLPTNTGSIGLPISFSEVSIPINFVFYFSIVFILVTDVLASLVLGLVSKGSERDGIKYIIPIVILSLAIFFGSRFILSSYFVDLFPS